MIILGIETSCDETAAAILQKDEDRITILSNVVASSANLQAKYGGIIPEQAAREQLRSIIPIIQEALSLAFNPNLNSQISNFKFLPPEEGCIISRIDAIAVTYGPGLIGSLLVGVETAKTLALVWNKPLIPINHLLGHFYANWINMGSTSLTQYSLSESSSRSIPKFPCLGLLVSGGHTDLVLFTDHNQYQYLGGTRDDAAGECFDKCARLLGLPYPGGPQISKLAEKGDPTKFKLPIPMKGSKDLDFSYSGLKTAVANLINTSPVILSAAKNLSQMRDSNKLRDPSLIVQDDKTIANLAASIEDVIVKSLIEKVVQAIKIYKVGQIMVAGGVAANEKLVEQLTPLTKDKTISLHVPSSFLCTDNGAMIAAAGFFTKPINNQFALQANPSLPLSWWKLKFNLDII